MPDQPAQPADDQGPPRDERDREVLEDKHDGTPRPDQPTPSDAATPAERGEGANAEFADTPDSLTDPPPGETRDADDTTGEPSRRREPDDG